MFLRCLVILVALAGPLAAYRVVFDPGHGGRDLVPHTLYGDKFDRRLGTYLDKFREGARYRGVWESEVMYDIALKAKALLDKTATREGRAEFRKVLLKYGKPLAEVEQIEAFISRSPSYPETYFGKNGAEDVRNDMNAPYRLYDYPDQKTEVIQPGTISRINALEPELVITLHLTHTEAPASGGMAAVLTPGYRTYELAYRYAHAGAAGRKKIRAEFANGDWANWFISDDRFKGYTSFMADAFIYFTGFWCKPDGLSTDFKKFRGHRQNLVSWRYADSDSIVEALYGKEGERYATNLAVFEPKGPFWEREKDEPEDWRREAGIEGFGGDNSFASHEIMRFTRAAFMVNGVDNTKTAPRILKPYLSTWAVPTYVNAVAAFVELAHTTSKRDHLRMAKYRHVYAEAVAVSAYSLLYGMNDTSVAKGKKLDLAKYENLAGGNYFKRVKK